MLFHPLIDGIGDFNEILAVEPKKGGRDKHFQYRCDFKETLNSCELEDLGHHKTKFTWINK